VYISSIDDTDEIDLLRFTGAASSDGVTKDAYILKDDGATEVFIDRSFAKQLRLKQRREGSMTVSTVPSSGTKLEDRPKPKTIPRERVQIHLRLGSYRAQL